MPYNNSRQTYRGIQMMYEVMFYETSKKKCPAEEFLKELEPKMNAKAIKQMQLLAEFGPDLKMPYSKHLEDGIFELRMQAEGNIARVLYFFISGKKIILTNGFIKKSEKTPLSEIELAKKYRHDYKKRTEKK
jgi:phage-related protein